jgi:membrane-associated phospholipid phosphatase
METHDTERQRAGERAAVLFGASAVAGAAFTAMAVATAKRKTVRADNRLHTKMRRTVNKSAREKARAAAPAIDKGGKWWVYTPVAIASAAAVLGAPPSVRRRRRGRRVGAAALLVAPLVAKAASEAMDRWLPQPRVGRRNRPTGHPVFPSGHGLGVAAVAFTTGYVVVREGLARLSIAAPAAGVAPIVIGLGRLVRERHLASDTVGGWLAGTSIAAALAGVYELARC